MSNDWSEKKEAAYQQMVEDARSRYNTAQGSWVDFAVHLRGIEHAGTWRRPDFSGFGDFLRAEFPAAWGMARYTNACKALEVYGVDFVRRLGIEPAHAITQDALIANPENVARLREACEAHYTEHGIMPGVDTVRDMVDRIVRPPRPVSKLVERRAQVTQLQRENARLISERERARRAIEERSALKEQIKLATTSSTRRRDLDRAEIKSLRVQLKTAKAQIRELERENKRLVGELQKAERAAA